MKSLKCFILFFCLSSIESFAGVIKLDIVDNGYPPYTLRLNNNEYAGIIMDVLKYVATKYKHRIQVVTIPRKRLSKMIRIGEADATIAAFEWITNPQDFIFTDPIIEGRDVLFSLRGSPLLFNKLEDLYGKSLATHLGYKYPFLDEAITSGKIIRHDALSLTSMLKLTVHKRTDAVVIDRDVGLWIIKNNPDMQGKLLSSDKAINIFELRLMFNKKWQSFVEQFNRELAVMRETGELRNIIVSYR